MVVGGTMGVCCSGGGSKVCSGTPKTSNDVVMEFPFFIRKGAYFAPWMFYTKKLESSSLQYRTSTVRLVEDFEQRCGYRLSMEPQHQFSNIFPVQVPCWNCLITFKREESFEVSLCNLCLLNVESKRSSIFAIAFVENVNFKSSSTAGGGRKQLRR